MSDDWKDAARRKMHPPSRPRDWSVQLNLPEGTDPLALIPDADQLARDLAPDGWVAVSGAIISGKGCTMAPRWRGWYVRLEYRPQQGIEAPDWYVTDHAVACFERLHRGAPEHARQTLERLSVGASFRERNSRGLEVWRSPRNPGGGLRWLIDPIPHPRDTRPRVVWVGYGNPPLRLYSDA